MAYPNQNVSAKQFLPTVLPEDPSAQLAARTDQLDMGWADRDLDPVLSASNPLASAVSQIKPPTQPKLGYADTNFKT